jgi:hypothetical protein
MNGYSRALFYRSLVFGLFRSTNRHQSPPRPNRHAPCRSASINPRGPQNSQEPSNLHSKRSSIKPKKKRFLNAGMAALEAELCSAAVSAADTASWWCAVALVALVLLGAVPWAAAARGGVRGRGRRDAAHHQRQVRGPVHRGAEPARARPRRRLPGARHRAQADQEHLAWPGHGLRVRRDEQQDKN